MPDLDLNPTGLARGAAATRVALYATGTDPHAVREGIAAAAAVAAHGWTVPDEATIADAYPLQQAPQSRSGWDRVRALAAARHINGVIVPALGHIGFTWWVWQGEQRFLRRHGVYLASVDSVFHTLSVGECR